MGSLIDIKTRNVIYPPLELPESEIFDIAMTLFRTATILIILVFRFHLA